MREYKNQSAYYYGNALKSVETGDVVKASEFLWGSMAEALKAVAVSKGVSLKSHGELRNYARALAKEQKDESIFTVFREAESLHRNFYEFGFELEDVRMLASEIREMVRKLLELASALGGTWSE